jgi:hypothetical protein
MAGTVMAMFAGPQPRFGVRVTRHRFGFLSSVLTDSTLMVMAASTKKESYDES